MKKVFFSLLVVAIAFMSSAFKNGEKDVFKSNQIDYVDGYLVQVAPNVWIRIAPGEDEGDCLTPAENPCKFIIIGSIQEQSTYSRNDILNNINSLFDAGNGNRLYVFPTRKNGI